MSPVPEPLSISLIVPAYNEEAYLGQCLDAIVAHAAAGACEVIVVDNNSTDRTREIAESYPEVTYVFEAAKGITKARQCGYRAAHGEILAYVDADTIMPAGWIEQVREEFARDSGLACLSGPYDYYDLPRFRRAVASAWFVAARPIYKVIGYLVVGGNFAIRRPVLEAMGGFDATIEFYGEDADIAKRARKFGRVFFSPRLVMPTSGRRLQEEGYFKMACIYFFNFVSIAVTGRPATHSSNDIR